VTVYELWQLMLDYIELGESSATARMKAHGAAAMNAAAQRIRAKRPDICTTAISGVVGGDGWTGTVTLAAGGQAISESSEEVPLGDEMPVGSSCWITGDLPGRNQIEYNGDTWSLLHPYAGSTSLSEPLPIRIVRDCIPLPVGTAAIVNNRVLLDDTRELAVLGGRNLYERAGAVLSDDYGSLNDGPAATPRGSGQPVGAYLETREVILQGGARQLQRRLRIAPIPNRRCRITFEVRRTPLEVTASMFATEGSIALAVDDVESILVPLALKQWSRSPWFKNAEARREITEDAAVAEAQLYALSVDGGSEITISHAGI
jgi:hypothetical protein